MQLQRHQHFWLGLHLIPNFGYARICSMLASFDNNVEALWTEKSDSLYKLDLSEQLIEQFIVGRDTIDLSSEVEKVYKHEAQLLTLEDQNYPELLLTITDPPPVLYVRGQLETLTNKNLAIVGTRKPSKYGWDVAHQMAYHLVQQDVKIVSGLAHGIDTASHLGALKGNGKTIAVMANGIDQIYPSDNKDLAHKIMRNGTLITEMPIGTPPLGKNFPRRNRIISGLSLGVLVAEAPEKSGALITVSSAIEQGRDVFAIPHNIFSKTGQGNNQLIQDGAKLVMRVRDVLEELNITHTNVQTKIQTEKIQPDNEIEVSIMSQLGADPIHVDDIARLTHLPAQVVTSTLMMLELKGLAQEVGPMQYCRARLL